MKGLAKYMQQLFRENKDPEMDRFIITFHLTMSLYIVLFILFLYHKAMALIAFIMLFLTAICLVKHWHYKQEQAQKEAKKLKNYINGTVHLMKNSLGKLASTLSLAPTENHGLKGTYCMQAADVIIISFIFLRKPEAEPLNDFAAERYRQILNASLWSTGEPHIDGDYFEFPLYFTKVFEMQDGCLCLRTIPCIDNKTYLIVQEYERQRQEKAAREREQMQQALSRFKP